MAQYVEREKVVEYFLREFTQKECKITCSVSLQFASIEEHSITFTEIIDDKEKEKKWRQAMEKIKTKLFMILNDDVKITALGVDYAIENFFGQTPVSIVESKSVQEIYSAWKSSINGFFKNQLLYSYSKSNMENKFYLDLDVINYLFDQSPRILGTPMGDTIVVMFYNLHGLRYNLKKLVYLHKINRQFKDAVKKYILEIEHGKIN